MKKITTKLLKKIVFAFGILYGINLLLTNVNILIPINLLTIGISAVLGIPGVISLFAIFLIIN